MKEQQKHVPEMDFLRAFAILAVLAIHVSAGFTSIPQINALMVINVGIDIFTHFAVPLFIFISGFLLYLKYNKNYSLKEFYQKRFWRIIPPYLVFTTFYLVFNAGIATIKSGVITLPSVLQILYAYFAAGGYYHLWFFLIIIELYLLYPLIVKIYNFFADRELGFLFLIISLILQLGWQVFGANFQLHLLGYDLSITNKIFLCRFFYFALGIYICSHYPVIKEWILKKSIWVFAIPTLICTIIGSSLWLTGISVYGSYNAIPGGSFTFYESLLQPFFYLFTFAFLFYLSNKIVNAKRNFKWLSIISLYSFGIYLIHPFFQVGFTYVIKIFGITTETVIYYPLVFAVVLVLSMVFVYIVRKFPLYKYIIG